MMLNVKNGKSEEEGQKLKKKNSNDYEMGDWELEDLEIGFF
jgi:hypothetical protein